MKEKLKEYFNILIRPRFWIQTWDVDYELDSRLRQLLNSSEKMEDFFYLSFSNNSLAVIKWGERFYFVYSSTFSDLAGDPKTTIGFHSNRPSRRTQFLVEKRMMEELNLKRITDDYLRWKFYKK